MYVVYIINNIHYLLNELKSEKFLTFKTGWSIYIKLLQYWVEIFHVEFSDMNSGHLVLFCVRCH